MLTISKLMDEVETSPSSTMAHICIEEFLYGSPDGTHLTRSFTYIQDLERMKSYTKEFWIQKLREHLLDKPYMLLRGKPSAKYAVELNLDETKRVEKQAQDLGEEKLKELDKKLEDAMKFNDRPIPQDVLGKLFKPLSSHWDFGSDSLTAERGHVVDAIPVPKGKIDFAQIESARLPPEAGEKSPFQIEMEKRLGDRKLPFLTQFTRR